MTALRAAVLLVLASLASSAALAQETTSEPAKSKSAKSKSAKSKSAKSKSAKDKAAAQEKADQEDASSPETMGVVDEDSAAVSPVAPVGADENPQAPVADLEQPVNVEAAATAPPIPAEYPIERVLRPIVLPRRMSEITLDTPNTFNPYVQSWVGRVRHGITGEIQAGLSYGFGTLSDGEYFAGKTFSLDGEYRVFDWLAAQLSVPIMVDPFALGVTVGAPMKFVPLERLRFDLFRDLVTFKISRFAPSVTDAAFNESQVEAAETNSIIEDGRINLNAGAIWQLQRQIAIEGRLGISAPDFEFQSDSPIALDLGLSYSSTNKLDIGGRLGFSDLNHADDSFGVWLLAALRI